MLTLEGREGIPLQYRGSVSCEDSAGLSVPSGLGALAECRAGEPPAARGGAVLGASRGERAAAGHHRLAGRGAHGVAGARGGVQHALGAGPVQPSLSNMARRFWVPARTLANPIAR